MMRNRLTLNGLGLCLLVAVSACSGEISDQSDGLQFGEDGVMASSTPTAGGDGPDEPGARPGMMENVPVEQRPPSGMPPSAMPPPPAGDPTDEPPGPASLNANAPPSANFDLSAWYLSLPREDDGAVLNIYERELGGGFEDPDFFFTGPDGGMVFKSPTEGPRTSGATSYTRSELREMLRRGDTGVQTRGVNRNNWVLSSAPEVDRRNAGAVDGILRATLAVNHVTETGDSSKQGRVVIGQIHANDDEPVRIYYHKLPNNELGSIYFAHEPRGTAERWITLIGNDRNEDSNPSDGIALNERFSYEIVVSGNDMTVSVTRENGDRASELVDMEDSGFDGGGQYLFFKAGVYNQNDTGDGDDYVQATFYALEALHD